MTPAPHPCLRYLDAPAAVDRLYLALGFSRQMVHAECVVVRHARLVLGGGVVMLGL